MNECGICHKGVYFFQSQMSTEDDYTFAVWHTACAQSYEEWARLIARQTIPSFEYEPDQDARFRTIQQNR